MDTERKDIYARVTDAIVNAIESGTAGYRMPWRTSTGIPESPVNAVSKRPYRGINVLVLWAIAQSKGYTSGAWATYKQWQDLGAQVRKGEKSANVVFWKFFDAETGPDEEQDTANVRRVPMARDYWVFNAEQVDGYKQVPQPAAPIEQRIASAERFFEIVGIEVKPGGNRAYYAPETDSVHMPAFSAFKQPIHYYSVLSHEATHWSGAEARLNRNLAGRFGSESYAMEELIAELGSAFLCAELSLPTDPRTDHAPYIESWLRTLKNDKRAIFAAAAKAQQAVDWMVGRDRPRVREAA